VFLGGLLFLTWGRDLSLILIIWQEHLRGLRAASWQSATCAADAALRRPDAQSLLEVQTRPVHLEQPGRARVAITRAEMPTQGRQLNN
jgi:hypothetical protein